jgi:hypothetical protein
MIVAGKAHPMEVQETEKEYLFMVSAYLWEVDPDAVQDQIFAAGSR